jgi:hypothetical protein
VIGGKESGKAPPIRGVGGWILGASGPVPTPIDLRPPDPVRADAAAAMLPVLLPAVRPHGCTGGETFYG